MALYLFAYSAFLEVMLLGNFSEGYLNNVEQSITDYSYQYRTLYTKCYDLMKDYSKSSVQAGILSGLSAASKFMGNAIAKVPVISKSQLDENLIEAGSLLGTQGEQRAVVPFVENIRVINNLYNKPVQYRIDGDSIYVQQVAD